MIPQDVTRETYPPPWSAQIELTYGCQLRCPMCALETMPIGRAERHFMTLETARKIASSLREFAPGARIEFAMRGEPLLNPQWQAIVSTFQAAFPRSSLLLATNGLEIRRDPSMLVALHELTNILLVDLYDPHGASVREAITKAARGWKLRDYFDGDFRPWWNHGPGLKTIVFVDDVLRRDGERIARRLSNLGGNSLMGEKVYQMKRLCTIVGREMVFHWDGVVPLCCEDWAREYPLGSIGESTVEQLWRSDRAWTARVLLRRGQRLFSPCEDCDERPAMSSLVHRYPEPTEADLVRAQGYGTRGKPNRAGGPS